MNKTSIDLRSKTDPKKKGINESFKKSETVTKKNVVINKPVSGIIGMTRGSNKPLNKIRPVTATNLSKKYQEE